MEKKTINLEEILDKHISYSSMQPPRKSSYIAAMQDACLQVLQLAAENVTTKEIKVLFDDPKEGDDAYMDFKVVNKESILNTINQIQ